MVLRQALLAGRVRVASGIDTEDGDLEDVCRSSSFLDFLLRRLAVCVCLDVQRNINIATAQYLYELPFADEAFGAKYIRRDLGGCLDGARSDQIGQLRHVHGMILCPEWVLESVLGNTALKGHLSPFEPDRNFTTAARFLTLVSFGCRVTTVAGALATTNALAGFRSPFCGLQIGKIHDIATIALPMAGLACCWKICSDRTET